MKLLQITFQLGQWATTEDKKHCLSSATSETCKLLQGPTLTGWLARKQFMNNQLPSRRSNPRLPTLPVDVF